MGGHQESNKAGCIMADYVLLVQQVEQLEDVGGISPATLLQLPDEVALIMRKISRQKSMDLEQFAAELELPDERASEIGTLLTQKGYLHTEHRQGTDATTYCVYFARMRKRKLPIDL